MSYAEDVLKRHDELKRLRQPYESTWRKIARLLRPDDTDFEGVSPSVDRDDDDIFDSTPLYANDALAGGIFGQLTNPTNRWFTLKVDGDDELNEYPPVKQHLWDRSSRILASLSPAVSSFYREAPAWFADGGAFGIGTLAQEERVGEGRIADMAIPLRQSFIDVDIDGNITTFHNAFRWRGMQLRRFFRERTPPQCRDDMDYTVVHAVNLNDNYRRDRLGWRFMRWQSCYVSPDLKDLIVEGGYNELPYHTFMWTRVAGRIYPTGPGHVTRADNATLQEMERSHLVAGQFAAEPPILGRSESDLSAADIVPNAFLEGTMSDRGEQLIDLLERKQQLQLSMAQSEQKRRAIQTAFMFGLMHLIDRPQMTATEFLGFQEEVLKLSAPALTRIQIGLSSFIARRDRILERAGQMPPPPPELVGRSVAIHYVSPLAKLQKVTEGRGVLQAAQAIEQIAVTDPLARDNFDGDVASRAIIDAFSEVPGLIRDPQRVQQMRSARAQAEQQQRQIEQAATGADIAATVSHAAQAATLSQQRQPAQ